MNMIKLQPRLQKIADLVPTGSRIVDVGTDHGYLPVYLIQSNTVQSAIASDINLEPLDHAKETARQHCISTIGFILCDGVSKINPDDVDVVVIAGMGGDTISSILSTDWLREKYCILQSMTKQEYLRKWLFSNGYQVNKEVLVLDKGHIYPIMIASGGINREITEEESYIGFVSREDPLYNEYINQKLSKLKTIIQDLKKSKNTSDDINYYEKLLDKLENS